MGSDPQVTPSPGTNVGGRQAAVNGAERLREAAALMRERALAASPSPWGWGDPGSNGLWQTVGVWAGDPDNCHGEIDTSHDAAHIASWHPAVARAVADWLDRVASDEPSWSYAHAATEAESALVVADTYLGTTS